MGKRKRDGAKKTWNESLSRPEVGGGVKEGGNGGEFFEGVDLYTKLPSVLRPVGFETGGSGGDAKGELDDILNDVLGEADVNSNEAKISSKLRDRALVLDAIYPTEKKIKVGKKKRVNSFVRNRLGGISKGDIMYSHAKALQEMWTSYVAMALAAREDNDTPLRIDLHGAEITISSAKDPLLVGVSGIVVVETANTVRVVSPADNLITIPRRGTTVTFRCTPSTSIAMNLDFDGTKSRTPRNPQS